MRTPRLQKDCLQRSRPHRDRADRDRGEAAVEIVILTPLFIVLLLLVVGLGRYAHAQQLTQQAAGAAARAASLTTGGTAATTAADRAARDTLTGLGLSCTRLDTAVDTSRFRTGGQVGVTVSCTADLSATVLAGLPGTVTVRATAAAPLETYRDLTAGGSRT